MLQHIPKRLDKVSEASNSEWSRIISAAVVNQQFRKQLLLSPCAAVSKGYCGELFNLTDAQKDKIASLAGSSMEEFALQLAQI